MSGLFWLFVAIRGLSQVLVTVCVVLLVEQRNFAVGIAFKKTALIQTALVGLVILGDRVSLGGWVAIPIGLSAVVVLSKPPGGEGLWWRHRAFLLRFLRSDIGAHLWSLGMALWLYWGDWAQIAAVWLRGGSRDLLG